MDDERLPPDPTGQRDSAAAIQWLIDHGESFSPGDIYHYYPSAASSPNIRDDNESAAFRLISAETCE